jgi:hypothetical protein
MKWQNTFLKKQTLANEAKNNNANESSGQTQCTL